MQHSLVAKRYNRLSVKEFREGRVLFTHTLLLLENKIDKCGLKIANQISQFPRKICTYSLKPHSYSRSQFTGKPEMNDPFTLDSLTFVFHQESIAWMV